MRKISDHLLDFLPTAKKRKLKKKDSSSKEKIKIAFEGFSKFGGLLTFIIAVLAFVFQFNFCENPFNKNQEIKGITDGKIIDAGK